jgi:L-2-hydroxyglutarate oxidase LhgO
MTEAVDVVIIGGGVVGLAVARAFAAAGREVLIIEKEAAIGLHTSSRNSEVIHAGIYYEPNSLKAKLCTRGKAMLYQYCAATGVGFKKTGKLIVAQSQAEIANLRALQQNALACGVNDLILLDGPEATRLEPALRCVAALLSPSTGIIDSGQLMLTLLGDAEASGATLVLHSQVDSGVMLSNGISLAVRVAGDEITHIHARLVINCAGHGAHDLAAAIAGYDTTMLPARFFAKGSYCNVSGQSPFAHHIYPVPVQGGLGTHVTSDMAGITKLGPDVSWISGPNYEVDQYIATKFKSACESFWPSIVDREVTPAYCGVRPKLTGPGEPNADFMVQTVNASHGTALINLFGIESPGLTSSLAIAEVLSKQPGI